MYYGNSSAKLATDGHGTGLYYDDFADSDISDWTTRNGSDFYQWGGELLYCDNNSTALFNKITAPQLTHGDAMVVYRFRPQSDANDDGTVDIADAIVVLGHLFSSSGDLPEPFGECGFDPTMDTLGCEHYSPCQ